ncbi:MAG: enoyl-CoA hydratase/isomerase family protein [Desulfarculaceae bacterium]|jgi:enoyl-CoA hydratase/carnithine racemase
MSQFALTEIKDEVGIITLNRPDKLNAWHTDMRSEIAEAIKAFESDPGIRALIMTGAGNRAFSAGQDLEQAHGFDPERAVEWIKEWDVFYSLLRSLAKPLVIALNGVAAGSAFQVALLGDVRVAHAGVKMGQPEINSGIASTTGPWIMKEMLGMSRTIELTLSGRMMSADECYRIGLIHHLVEESEVLAKAIEVAKEFGQKPPVAMRLNKQRFREMTQETFESCIEAGIRIQAESYASGEPARMMEEFFKQRKSKA